MGKNFHSDDKVLREIVALFESNLRSDTSTFLPEEEFEELIDYYDQTSNTRKALLAIEHAQHAFPYSGNFYIKLAQVHLQDKNIPAAKNAVEQALIYEPSSTELMLVEADILVAELKYEAAIEQLIKLSEAVSKQERADVYLEIADVCELKLDTEKMADWLKKCLFLDPSNEEALNRYWNYIDDCHNYESAVIFHQELIDRSPYNFLAWNNLGNAYEELGLYEKAISAYEFAIAINESYYYVYWDLASCYEKMGDWEKAKDIFLEIADQFEQEPQILIEIGKCEEKMGNYDIAREKFRKACDALNGNIPIANTYYLIGKTYEKENNLLQSIFYYQKALEFQKDRSKYWKALGKIQFEIGQFIEAAGSFIKGIELTEQKPKLWLYLAQSYHALKMSDMVINVLDRAISVLPESGELRCARAAYALAYGSTQEGLELLTEALDVEPKLKSSIFALFPELEHRSEVLALLENY